MENYKITVNVSRTNGEILASFDLDSKLIEEAKLLHNSSIIEEMVMTIINEAKQTRRDNPHHHQNRID